MAYLVNQSIVITFLDILQCSNFSVRNTIGYLQVNIVIVNISHLISALSQQGSIMYLVHGMIEKYGL